MSPFALLVMVVVVALIFEFINGFHDTANAIATVVSTGVLKPRQAIALATACNVVGALQGTTVAATLGNDLLDPAQVGQPAVLAALIAAVTWNLITWYFGIPSSSSHALLGGLLGAALAAAGPSALHAPTRLHITASLLLSPILGFTAALLLMVGLYRALRRTPLPAVNRAFRPLQILSAASVALSHGTNDAQKTMGVITLALLAYDPALAPGREIPPAVVAACALVMGAGTAAGGWRIIRTMGHRIFKLRPVHGFAAETAAALVVQTAAHLGLPASTTHCTTAAILGAGATTRLSAVSWSLTRRIVWAWVFTVPFCMILAGVLILVWG